MINFVKRFFKGIKALGIGHLTVFKHIFKKKVTLEYPEKRCDVNENFRGCHVLDNEKCGGCEVCIKVCPANAITIIKEKNPEGKIIVKDYIVDLNRCIFCGNCQYYCTQSAVKLSENFELASEDKLSLILHLKKNSESIINEKEAK